MIGIRQIRLALQAGVREQYRQRRLAEVQAKHRGKLTDEEVRFEVEREDAEAAALSRSKRSELMMRQAMAARAGITGDDVNLL